MCINILYLIRNYSYYIVPTSYGYTRKNKFIYSYLPSIPNINYSSCMNSYRLKENSPLFSNGGLTNAFPNALYAPMQMTYALEHDIASCYCKSGR